MEQQKKAKKIPKKIPMPMLNRNKIRHNLKGGKNEVLKNNYILLLYLNYNSDCLV